MGYPCERRLVPWDHPDAFDPDLLAEQLETLADGRAIRKPVYNFVTHARREECELVEPADVIVIDGILLFTEARIRDLCDVKVFVDADADVRVLMIVAKIQRRLGAGRA